MVNPAKYQLDTASGERLICVEPVFEEIGGGDLLPTGRYMISEADGGHGEIRYDGDVLEWEWSGPNRMEEESIARIARFILEYNEPELAGYLD